MCNYCGNFKQPPGIILINNPAAFWNNGHDSKYNVDRHILDYCHCKEGEMLKLLKYLENPNDTSGPVTTTRNKPNW